MATYSKQLAAGSESGGAFHVVYTAPASGTVVIRQICMYMEGAASDYLQLVLNGSERLFSVTPPSASTAYNLSGRWVLNPGDEISTYADSGTYTYFLSGYLLQ